MIFLLGRADAPTDALHDYCIWLARALDFQGHSAEILRVEWLERGWFSALTWLWREARNWRGQWVILQYTALGWSRRGLPFGVLCVLRVLRFRGAHIAIVYHDAGPYEARNWIHRLRREAQRWIMRRAYAWSEHSILTVPVENTNWLPSSHGKAVFIPVGANIPEAIQSHGNTRPHDATKIVAVFGVTGEPDLKPEASLIAQIVRPAAEKFSGLRLIVLGRNAEGAAAPLREALSGLNVALDVHGVLPPEEIAGRLAEADALLFVRGGVSSRRGSALAGIACGLPVVAYSGRETGPPVTEAGVALAPEGDREALAAALTRVLSDDVLRAELRLRSFAARDKYFSWDVIARNFVKVMNLG